MDMDINSAIIKRIEEICEEKKINVCEAALGGVFNSFGDLRPVERQNEMP